MHYEEYSFLLYALIDAISLLDNQVFRYEILFANTIALCQAKYLSERLRLKDGFHQNVPLHNLISSKEWRIVS